MKMKYDLYVCNPNSQHAAYNKWRQSNMPGTRSLTRCKANRRLREILAGRYRRSADPKDVQYRIYEVRPTL